MARTITPDRSNLIKKKNKVKVKNSENKKSRTKAKKKQKHRAMHCSHGNTLNSGKHIVLVLLLLFLLLLITAFLYFKLSPSDKDMIREAQGVITQSKTLINFGFYSAHCFTWSAVDVRLLFRKV